MKYNIKGSNFKIDAKGVNYITHGMIVSNMITRYITERIHRKLNE